MDERTQQIIEDSEKIRDRNRDLESELHSLKVENERLKEENETLFATQVGADPQNLRDALQWLHDQGGIGAVYSRYKDVVLGEAEEALEVMYSEDIEKRLMPEGMEWPRFEDGELVIPGDEAVIFGRSQKVNSIQFFDCCIFLQSDDYDKHVSYGERVKRPAKVLDADGVEIDVGDDIYSIEGSLKFHVSHVDRANGKIATDVMFTIDKWADPKMYTHRAPVLAADGKPLREGETVYHVVHNLCEHYAVVKPEGADRFADCRFEYLTHERPDTRAQVIDGMDKETVEKIDKLVRDGRWLDD